ncbi:MAG: hypothetical protein QOD12_2725 [Verrucomicrobiota bacterium]
MCNKSRPNVVRVSLLKYKSDKSVAKLIAVTLSLWNELDERAELGHCGGGDTSRQGDKGKDEPCDAHKPNENKMSDGGRGRALLGVKVWKPSQKWSVQRSAVRSIAWLDDGYSRYTVESEIKKVACVRIERYPPKGISAVANSESLFPPICFKCDGHAFLESVYVNQSSTP